MGTVLTTYMDRVRFTLIHKIQGAKVIVEPEGWQDDEKEYARHETYHGIITKFSNALKFVDEAADYINMIFDIYGINAELRLVKEERHPHTDIWEKIYDGYLDMSTREREDGQVSIKFNSGGLEVLLKARETEKIEIDRETTIDGLPIDPLIPKIVELDGRRIFLQTTYDIEQTQNTARASVQSDNGSTRQQTVGVPWHLVNQSHEQAHDVLPEATGNELNGTTGQMFFAVSDVDRTFNIKFNLNFITNVTRKDSTSNSRYRVCLTKYTGGTDYIRSDENIITLFDTEGNGGLDALGGDAYTNLTGVNNNPKTFHNVSYDGLITLLAGESLSLEFWVKSTLGSLLHDGHLDVVAESISGNLSIDEDSFFDKSSSKVVLAHEMASRLVTIATNKKNAFYSDFLGRTDLGYATDGAAAYTGLTHGYWIRGFDKIPINDANRFKAISTSFKDFMTSFSTIWNLGLGIERVGNNERVRVEDLRYFYNKNVTISLPLQVKKVKRTEAIEYYFSSVQLGYEKGGEYEEAMGLDEPNAITNWTTIITRIKETYSQLSKYRADSYGLEFARRKPKLKFPTDDTRYDEDVFALDLKPGIVQNSLVQRKWQDDFEIEPKGIFSPETAGNIRFSPFNLLLRHGWMLQSGLLKYPDEYIRYGSSTANSALKTKLYGKNEYSENGNIINDELDKSRFIPEWVEFEHEVTFEISKKLEGNTVIGGKTIPNFYGLVEFINEYNIKEKGFLFNVKPNGSGKWKILKANR